MICAWMAQLPLVFVCMASKRMLDALRFGCVLSGFASGPRKGVREIRAGTVKFGAGTVKFGAGTVKNEWFRELGCGPT